MNQLIRKYIMVLAAIFCLMLTCSSVSYAEEAESVIRVGFPMQPGLTMKDENGNYTGYTYDYLKEIGQYTGWTYEFVEPQDSGTIDEQLIQMMDMLEQGELDLIGAMNNNNQTSSVYDFPSENYGNAYSYRSCGLSFPLRRDRPDRGGRALFGVCRGKAAEKRRLCPGAGFCGPAEAGEAAYHGGVLAGRASGRRSPAPV